MQSFPSSTKQPSSNPSEGIRVWSGYTEKRTSCWCETELPYTGNRSLLSWERENLPFKMSSKVFPWSLKKSWMQHNEKASNAERAGRVQMWQGRVDLTCGNTYKALYHILPVQALSHLYAFRRHSGQCNKVFFFSPVWLCPWNSVIQTRLYIVLGGHMPSFLGALCHISILLECLFTNAPCCFSSTSRMGLCV